MTETDKNIDRIIDEAAEWFVLFDADDVTEEDKSNFAEWLNMSPVHAREYAEISGLWDETALYGSELDTDQSIIQLYPDLPSIRPTPPVERTFWGDWRKIAAALFIGILLAGSSTYMMTRTNVIVEVANAEIFETQKGESRRFRLSDGSFVQLNTNSRIEVKYSDYFREINLIKGEAFFDVAKNKSKPFIVEVGNMRVRALGTQFNINKRLKRIEVTVLEGKIRVSKEVQDRPDNAQKMWVSDIGAGEQVITLYHDSKRDRDADQEFYKSDHLNLQAILSWRDNKLMFDNRDLIDVIEDFNRHNDQIIILADPGLSQLKITGTFNPNDPESFIQSMVKIANIRSEIKSDGNIFLFKANKKAPQ